MSLFSSKTGRIVVILIVILLVLGGVVALMMAQVRTIRVSDAATSLCEIEESDIPTIKTDAAPQWSWIRLGDSLLHSVYARIPSHFSWTVDGQPLTLAEATRESGTTSTQYTFGRAFTDLTAPSCAIREYTLRLSQGTAYEPSFSNYTAQAEVIGENSVTIYRPIGDTDCPEEHAVLLKGGFVVTLSRTCQRINDEARSILSSIF